MSRMLSELLGADESTFRLNIRELEKIGGTPNADIRLGSFVHQATKTKIRQLGLDPDDTTGAELYAALQDRFKADERRIRNKLGLSELSSPDDVLGRIETFLEKIDAATEAFVLKPAVMRNLLKKLSPKATLKRLGYRSLDSMLKHEPVPQLFAAVWLSESREWHKHLIDSYAKLTPADFETRRVSFYYPTSKQWPSLASEFVREQKHNILCIRELGAVVILPIPEDLPGLAITTLLLGIENINDIRSQSSFLKLQQVRPDFGELLVEATRREPMTHIEMAGQNLPWKVIQRFYAKGDIKLHPEVFEPHVHAEDLTWHEAEAILAQIHPVLDFWRGSQMLGLLDAGRPVSCNLLDIALSVCNHLPYADRIARYMRGSLWHELISSYLHQESLESMVLGQLNRQLVPELAYDSSDSPDLPDSA